MIFAEIKHDYIWGPAVETGSTAQNIGDLLAGITIDAWETANDTEQGTVVANVLLSQRGDIIVDFHDNGSRLNEQVLEHIRTAQRELEQIWRQHIQKRLASRYVTKLGYSATLAIPSTVAAQIDGYLNADGEETYQGEDHTITYTVQFLDGRQMDIKCCGCQDESSWTEAVLFDSNGNQLCCTEPAEEFIGAWTLKQDGIEYRVIVTVAGEP